MPRRLARARPMSRPELLHERLAAHARELLAEAMNDDLTIKKRSALTLLRVDLDAAKRLQPMSGEVASWAEWRAASDRVQEEINRRPLDPRHPRN